jgi:hypothetical protein
MRDYVRPSTRIIFSVLIILLFVVWVSLSEGDYAALARSFLRQLVRQMF